MLWCLYRSAGANVIRIVALGLLAVAPVVLHAAPKASAAPKGPRAIGVVEITKTGKAQLVPIAIFDRGKWYDAQAYQANPVPMAAQWDTVYEATELGESRGLFTITGPQKMQDRWVAKGKWQPGAGDDGGGGKKPVLHTAPKKSADPDEERPVLHKHGSAVPTAPAATGTAPAATPAPVETKAGDAKAEPNPDARSDAKAESRTAAPADDDKPSANATPTATGSSGTASISDDPDRPTLRHGRPSGNRTESDLPSVAELHAAATAGGLTIYAAFSAAHNPELRSYKFYFQPGEEEAYRKKMLDLARTEVLNRARLLGLLPPAPAAPSAKPVKNSAKPAKPAKATAPAAEVVFDEINLRSFDLTYSNEPEFVLAVKARILRNGGTAASTTLHAPKSVVAVAGATPLPAPPPVAATSALTYDVTLAARADLNGDLRRLLLVATDERHLDELPRLELIDAVDADGDGIGDFLFREVSGSSLGAVSSNGYVIYQTGRDQLWELFRTAR